MEDSAPKRRRTSPRTSVEVRLEQTADTTAQPSVDTSAKPTAEDAIVDTISTPTDPHPRNGRNGPLFHTDTNTLTGRLPERTRSSLTKPVPEAPFNPLRGRALQRSPVVPGVALAVNPPLDPKLPPTRVELGLDDPVVTSLALGIHHSSSPSRRNRKRKQHGLGTPTKNSSLSQVQSTADDADTTQNDSQPPLRSGSQVATENQSQPALLLQRERSLSKPPLSPYKMKKEITKRQTMKTKSKAKWSAPKSRPSRDTHDVINPTRGIEPRDKYWEKRQLIAKLKKEVELLQEDLEFAMSENDRIREHVLKQSTVKLDGGDKDQVMQLLQTYVLPKEAKPEKTVAAQMFDIALNPMGWLPFSGMKLPILRKITQDVEEPVKSHAPVKMSAEEELPFLQLFTPLEFNSRIVILKQKENGPVLTRHTITAVPKAEPGAFACRLDMIVDTQKMSIVDLAVPEVDPQARVELGVFLEELVRTPRNRSHKNNICVSSWAMAEWYRVAMNRATLWCTLSAETEGEDGVTEFANRERSKKRTESKGGFPRADIYSRLGQQAMEIPVSLGSNEKGMKMRIQWRIGFDWTGEAVSETSLMVGVPGKWQKADKHGTLSKVSGMFNEMVTGSGDVLGATKSMIALLAGSSS